VPSSCPARRKVLQPCRSAHTPSMVRVRILERSLATPTHRPVRQGYAHGGGRGTSAVLAHTAARSALSEYARTTAHTALGHCGGRLPAYSRPRAARVRARKCDGACRRTQGCLWTPTGRRARTQAQSAASRARRAHRPVSKLSADSAAGIVPFSLFAAKDLQRAWFVPLCSEMRMHRSVPRTNTSTARGGRMGRRPRVYWTRVLEGGAARVPSSCPGDERCSTRAAVRTHLPQYFLRILERSLATHTLGPVLRR
jgi:hypothetical protein